MGGWAAALVWGGLGHATQQHRILGTIHHHLPHSSPLSPPPSAREHVLTQLIGQHEREVRRTGHQVSSLPRETTCRTSLTLHQLGGAMAP